MSTITDSTSTETQTTSLSPNATTLFGFWMYLMTDCVLFASLFATYAVLRSSTFGGPSGHDIFSLPFVLGETLLLLTSSFTAGLATLASMSGAKKYVALWFGVTFLLGLGFLSMEISEFSRLSLEGNGWNRSGFLSAFFTLVGTHGLHITAGLIWMAVLTTQTLYKGLTIGVLRRIKLLSMFWHFLDVIWILIFTIVYLMGVMP